MAGSIEKRGKDSYRLIVCHGFDLDGKAIRHTKTIKGTKSQAKIELAKFVTEVEQGSVVDGKVMTFREFTEIWKQNYGKKELVPTTYARYVGVLETRILPYLGRFKLDKITPTDIMKFYDMLEKDTQIRKIKCNNGYRTLKPLSNKTILEHHKLLHAMLHKAVYWQLLYSNPCERVQPPKAKKAKHRYYDDEQCQILLKNLVELPEEQIKYKVAITLTLFTGLRLGELAGLEWTDIDFNNGIVSINKCSQYLASKGIFTKEPKTESSIRDIAIPNFVVSLLQEYSLWYENQKSLYGELWQDSNRLFIKEDGAPIHPSTISKWFVKFVEKIGLPVINFHGLRHTNATLLISQNIDVAVVAARLGHSQITTTFNFYVHPIMSHNKIAGSTLENLLLTK